MKLRADAFHSYDAAFELLPRMDRAATVSVDGTLLARNQLIGWYIFRITGEERRRKQVMSRLQVLLSTTSRTRCSPFSSRMER